MTWMARYAIPIGCKRTCAVTGRARAVRNGSVFVSCTPLSGRPGAPRRRYYLRGLLRVRPERTIACASRTKGCGLHKCCGWFEFTQLHQASPVHAHCITIGSWVGTGSISITQVSLWPHLDAQSLIEMCHGQAARRQRREQPCVWHDGTEIASGFQTKPWLVAMTACSTRYRPPAELFGYEVFEPSQSWMTVSQHQGARGSHAAPPPQWRHCARSSRTLRMNLENPATLRDAQ